MVDRCHGGAQMINAFEAMGNTFYKGIKKMKKFLKELAVLALKSAVVATTVTVCSEKAKRLFSK